MQIIFYPNRKKSKYQYIIAFKPPVEMNQGVLNCFYISQPALMCLNNLGEALC